MDYTGKFIYMIHCDKCSRAWSLEEEDLKKEIIICQDPTCASEFTIYEGIKKSLKNFDENSIQTNTFLANYTFIETINVKVGFLKKYELPEGLSKIYKVEAYPFANFIAGISEITSKGFNIFTSIKDDSSTELFGTEAKLTLFINAKAENYTESWMHLLQLSLENLLEDDYLTSVLLAEIAFESFIDSFLSSGYSDNGLDADTISRLLTATTMPIKLHKLMNNVYGAKYSEMNGSKGWEKKLLKWRNEIAHGTKTSLSKEEAVFAYELVVDSIFFLIEKIDDYFRGNRELNGLFYRT